MDAAVYLKPHVEGATAVLQVWPHKPCMNWEMNLPYSGGQRQQNLSCIPAVQALDSGTHSCSASNCSAAAADWQLQLSAYNSLIPLAVLSQMLQSALSPTMLSALVQSPAAVAEAERDSWPPEASWLNLQQVGIKVSM